MKRISFLFLSVFLISIIISSCSNNVTYAEQLAAEKLTIASYIKRDSINVITKVPANNVWGKKDYLLTSNGIYFHLVDSGDAVTPEIQAKINSGEIPDQVIDTNDVVIPRYIEYTLDVNPKITLRDWSTQDYPFPTRVFTYANTTQEYAGFQEVAGLMKRNNSQAKVIIPTKMGFYYSSQDVTPHGYDIKIKIQKTGY